MSNKSCSLLFALLIVNCSLLIGLDFSLRPKGFAYIPMGQGNIAADGNERYAPGGGADIGLEVDFTSIWPNPFGIGWSLGLEGGLLINPLKIDEPKSVSLFSLGTGLGLFYFPLSRLLVRADGAVGVYLPGIERESGSLKLYWRGGGEIGFRFTPGFTLAVNSGWRHFSNTSDSSKTPGNVFSSGLYAGLTAQLTFQAGSKNSGEGIRVTINQHEAVYPAFMQLYQINPVGIIVIRNNESAEIRNVRVSFRASGYTSSEFPCGAASFIARGRSRELPLLADFSPEILRFTDKGRILGEVVIRYNFLGKEKEELRTVTIAANNRNMVTAGDTSALAAFISPTSPETLNYARFIAGLSRANRRTGHNQNMQYAVWFLEGLRASGIALGETYGAKTEVQFPAETLLYGTGNSRDLALLFASGLEGVGINSGFIQTENDFLVAFSLGINISAAETLFDGVEKILIIDGYVWLPLSMSAFNEGFMAAWTRGAEILSQTFAEGKEVEFVILEEAWALYPPAPLPAQERNVIRTDTEAAAKEVNRAMQQYITRELEPLIRQIQSQINTTPTMALYNRLGIVQARAGRIAEAKAAYERAAGMGSVPAMTNRGNLALSERDYAAAELWFRRALAIDSGNRAALRGLEQTEGSR